MNIRGTKTAVVAALLTAGTVLGGCGKAAVVKSEDLIRNKRVLDSLETVFKRDSVEFVNKAVKTPLDSLVYNRSETNLDIAKIQNLLGQICYDLQKMSPVK